MASTQTHITFSGILGLAYVVLGLFLVGTYPECTILAFLVILIAGILPDIDSGNEATQRELGGVFAIIAPLLVLEYFPGYAYSGGMARVALIILCGYFITRYVCMYLLQKFTSPRGMVHSIPAAIIAFELCYLLFWDMFWVDRLYLAGAAFFGYLAHLFLDAYSNVNLVGRAFGKSTPQQPVLTFVGNSWPSTFGLYTCLIVLGYFVLRDVSPVFSTVAGL